MELRVERRDELLVNRKLYALEVLDLSVLGEGVVRGVGGRLFRNEDFRGGVFVGGATASRWAISVDNSLSRARRFAIFVSDIVDETWTSVAGRLVVDGILFAKAS